MRFAVQEFPFHSNPQDLARYDPQVAHFLALCVKVITTAIRRSRGVPIFLTVLNAIS